jgi:hypothetical protein
MEDAEEWDNEKNKHLSMTDCHQEIASRTSYHP